jgi:Cu2+-exporting ATPase
VQAAAQAEEKTFGEAGHCCGRIAMRFTAQQPRAAALVFTADSAERACAHCGLRVPAARDDAFCCQGCAAVYQLMAGHGLVRFYELGGGRGHPVGALPEPAPRSWLAELEEKGNLGDGRVRVVLDVQGIHCAACVYVLQELWRRQAGGVQLRVNPALGQAELLYRRDGMALARYLDEIERLGYRVAPASKKAQAAEAGLLVRMGVCVALAMNAMLFSVTEYFGLSAGDGSAFALFRGVSCVLATLAVLVGGPVFFAAAAASLRQRVLHLDLPIALGIAVSWAGSAFAYLSGRGEPYFDTVTIFVALMLVGRYLQQRAIGRNRDYLLADDGLAHLRVRRVVGRDVETVRVEAITVGDVLLLAPGDLLPVAARLRDASASFALDWINGESEPRAFAVGDAVPAGACLAGRRTARVAATADVRTSGLLALLAQPAHGREDLRGHGAFWAAWNKIYVAAVLALATLGAIVWALIDPARVVPVTVALLVVTCPCALGIATPLAFNLAVAALRRRGVLVCAGSVLSKARHVRKVILDKTGTVTWGGLRAEVSAPPPADLRDVAAAMAASSSHPVSRAIAAALGVAERAPVLPDGELEEIAGAGLELRTAHARFRLGSGTFATGGKTHRGECVFAEDGTVRARFALHEDLRADFVAEVARLHAIDCEVHLCSGDQQAKVDAVAQALGVRSARARGGMQPVDKAAYVRALDRDDTMMLGDGINDAPAFGAAFVAGTPALDRPVLPARADFCYAAGRPAAAREVIAASRRFHAVVTTNLALGLAYNASVVTLSLLGAMSPVLCAILMPLSSLALIAHTSVRLRGNRVPA